MEQDLQSVEFSVLDRVAAHVQVSQEWQVLDIGKLTSFADIVQLHP